MELSEALVQNAFGFVSALIGAVVGGVFTLYAARISIREENAKEDRQEEKEVQNLLDALGVEISALWSFHMRRVGEAIEVLPEGEPLEFYYPLTQDYFTLYNANAAVIGKIKDPALRKSIVVCYNKCKKVVDGFKYNNDLYQGYQQFMLTDANSHRALARKKEMTAYANIIKEDHFELKRYVADLIARLGAQ